MPMSLARVIGAGLVLVAAAATVLLVAQDRTSAQSGGSKSEAAASPGTPPAPAPAPSAPPAPSIGATAATAASPAKPGDDSKPASPPPPVVTVSRPLVDEVIEWDEYTARFDAVEMVEVRPRVSGYLDEVAFKDGQFVKKGDLLFVIDPRPFERALEAAKAELEALQGAVGANAVRTPRTSNSKTYGDWPNGDRLKKNRNLDATFPIGASLAGQHAIEGTYTTKIDFTLPDNKSFMQPVKYTSTSVLPSGALALRWGAPGRATGYSVGVMAPEKMDDESANIVMWSSAQRPATFVQMEHLTPAEVKRLIELKAMLPADTTDCTVPAEVMKFTKNGSMLMFTAYGDEATFIHPARPADPAVTWDQEWFARVSYKSVRMDMVSKDGVMDMGAMTSGGGAKPDPKLSDEEYCAQLAQQQRGKPSVADAIPGGRLLGRFGRKKEEAPPPPPDDPRCANLQRKK